MLFNFLFAQGPNLKRVRDETNGSSSRSSTETEVIKATPNISDDTTLPIPTPNKLIRGITGRRGRSRGVYARRRFI